MSPRTAAAILAACLLAAPAAPAGEAAGGASGTAEIPDPEPNPELAARIAELVKELSAEKYEQRAAAADELKRIGRPALAALRAAQDSGDAEVAETARRLIAEIEGGKVRTTVKLTVKGTPGAGDHEVIVTSSVDTVTVRDLKEAFAVEIKPARGELQLYSEPDRASFRKKHPEIWSRYAEPALDTEHPERAVMEAMIRETMAQVRRQFHEKTGREATAKELAALERQARKIITDTFARQGIGTRDVPAGEDGKKIPSPPAEQPDDGRSGPGLTPLE
jgi:hypothetical protein